MNKYYGKGISTALQKEVWATQNKYGLNDLQMSGLLQAFDFTERVAALDHDSLHEIKLVTYKKDGHHNAEDAVHNLPSGTKAILSAYKDTRAARKHFCPMHRHKTFARFADRLLKERLVLSDYIGHGVLKIRPINVEVRGYA